MRYFWARHDLKDKDKGYMVGTSLRYFYLYAVSGLPFLLLRNASRASFRADCSFPNLHVCMVGTCVNGSSDGRVKQLEDRGSRDLVVELH